MSRGAAGQRRAGQAESEGEGEGEEEDGEEGGSVCGEQQHGECGRLEGSPCTVVEPLGEEARHYARVAFLSQVAARRAAVGLASAPHQGHRGAKSQFRL